MNDDFQSFNAQGILAASIICTSAMAVSEMHCSFGR
jgi:hypothetical protein